MEQRNCAIQTMSAEQSQQSAERKFPDDVLIADDEARRAIHAEAERLKLRARVKGWLNSPLRAPD